MIDGLDEVPFGSARTAIIKAIQEIAELQLTHVKVLILSRPESDIRESLETNARWKQQAIPRDATNCDIAIFVKQEMARNTQFKSLPETSKSEIRSRLIGSDANM